MLSVTVLCTALVSTGAPSYVRAGPGLARPTPAQVEWQDMELEMFLCLDPCTWQEREYDDHSTPLAAIDPEQLDTDQWARVALSMGARQILFVAKHTGGFCWWQTETSDYGVRQTPWRGGRGDVVADLAESCRKHGLKLGLYLSPADDVHGAAAGGRCPTAEAQAAYARIYRQQLAELLGRYGTISEIWFDGNLVIDVADILDRYAPDAMVFQGPRATIRWVGNEEGFAPYPAWNAVARADAVSGGTTAAHGTPDGDVWLPIEVDTVNVSPHCWFWKRSPERRLRTVAELMDCYYRSVGHGAVLLLNQTPDTRGLIPEEDARVAAEFGAETRRRFGRSLAETRGRGTEVILDLHTWRWVDHVVTMEEIRRGERIRGYSLEGKTGSGWQELCRGTAVGHKRIDRFAPVWVSAIRLRCTQSAAPPVVRKLAAYYVGESQPRAGSLRWTFDRDEVGAAAGLYRAELRGARVVRGFEGGALRLDGYGAHASLGAVPIPEGDFTIAAWVCPRTVTRRERIIVAKERSGVADNQLRLYLAPGNRVGFIHSDGEGHGAWPFAGVGDPLPAKQWSRVAVTRGEAGYAAWVNGEAVATSPPVGAIRHSNMLELRAGARYAPSGDGADSPFDGLIDEVILAPRALSEAELQPSPAARARMSEPVEMPPMQRGPLARPTPQQAEWHDLEVGMFLHFAPNTWQNQEGDDLSTPLDQINPERLDTDQWVSVAQSMGAKYIVFVAKHVGGFCWWQTDTTDYSVGHTPWRGGRGDVMADLADSCRRRGMKLGVYISPCDRRHGIDVGGRAPTPEAQAKYNALYRRQLTELLSRYGDMIEVWFDGNIMVPVGDILQQHAPRAMVFQSPHATIRWVGTESGFAPYPAWNGVSLADARSGSATAAHGNPDGDAWLPNEVDTVNVSPHYWFWNTDPRRRLKTVDELMDCYDQSVGRGAVLLLNQTPDTSGLIPEADARRAAEFGAEVRRRFGIPVAETQGRGETIELELPRTATVDHVITMEDIREGEGVREYVVEGLVGAEWRELCRGSAIGHKRIDRFPPAEVSGIRLRCIESAGEPIIRRLAAYHVGGG